MINIALPKGRLGEKICRILSRAGYDFDGINDGGRRLVFMNEALNMRCFWVKPFDVGVYVERGVADVGFAGKDILMECQPDVYELMRLEAGKCRMCAAGMKGFRDVRGRVLRVATEFPNIAREYYGGIGRDIDVIELRGSMEIAPVLGLSDVIVDVVESGTTLRENDLEVIAVICEISVRFIANKSAYKFKGEIIREMMRRIAHDNNNA